MTVEPLLKIAEVAKLIGMSRASVRRLCDDGKLVFVRPMGATGHRRFLRSDVNAYLQQIVNERSATQDYYKRVDTFAPSTLSSTIARIRAGLKNPSPLPPKKH